MERIQAELDNIINDETKRGVKIKKIIKEGDPIEEIMKVIDEEKIDMVIMRTHEEGRIERLLIGGSNDEIIRAMPCSIFLVKQETCDVDLNKVTTSVKSASGKKQK